MSYKVEKGTNDIVIQGFEQGIANDPYIDKFLYENYGGSPVLGINKPVIIGHGISPAKAFKNMINMAANMIETDLCGKIKESFTQ